MIVSMQPKTLHTAGCWAQMTRESIKWQHISEAGLFEARSLPGQGSHPQCQAKTNANNNAIKWSQKFAKNA